MQEAHGGSMEGVFTRRQRGGEEAEHFKPNDHTIEQQRIIEVMIVRE